MLWVRLRSFIRSVFFFLSSRGTTKSGECFVSFDFCKFWFCNVLTFGCLQAMIVL